EQAPEPPAVDRVALERRLVVDRRQQPLVADVEQRQARRLVDAAALRVDDAVLDLVGMPSPCRPPTAFAARMSATGSPSRSTSLPLYVDPSPQMSTPCSAIVRTSSVPVTARPSGVVLK